MQASQRQKQIEHLFLEKKELTVSELSSLFNVSFETIRRDLKVLEKKGIVEKSYGGATLRNRVKSANYDSLTGVMVDVKREMARAAMQFLSPGDCVYIDFSTTCLQLAELIADSGVPLTVFTNSLPVMNELAHIPNISLFAGGGKWEENNQALMGFSALEFLRLFHMDKAFISCRAINMKDGLSDASEAESSLRSAVIGSSEEVYLLMDHTKFDNVTFVKTADFSRVKVVITDSEPDGRWKDFFKKRNISCLWQ